MNPSRRQNNTQHVSVACVVERVGETAKRRMEKTHAEWLPEDKVRQDANSFRRKLWLLKKRGIKGVEVRNLLVTLIAIMWLIHYMRSPLKFKLPREETFPKINSEMYTVQIMTYRRPATLIQTITYLMQAPSMEKIIVLWNDVDTPVADTDLPRVIHTWPKPVEIVVSRRNDVTARWKWNQHCTTEAVFNIDDDAYINVDAIESAFKVWKHYPDRLVGLYNRAIFLDETTNSWEYALRPTEAKHATKVFGMVIGKTWFAGRTIMKAASDNGNPRYKQLQNFLHDPQHERKGCDDIAWNMFLHSEGFPKPVSLTGIPVFGVGQPGVTGYNVSSDQDAKGWLQYRKRCVEELIELFGATEPPLAKGLLHTVPLKFPLVKYWLRYQRDMRLVKQVLSTI